MKKRGGLGLAIIGILLLYLLFWPVPVNSTAFTPLKAPPLTGVYEQNTRLQVIERFGEGVGPSPEDLAFDAGHIYTGLEDGRIMRLEADGSFECFANTGGRPLGMAFDTSGNLIVADREKGLLSIAPDGSITVLVTEADGKPLVLANDLDITADGIIYFSDSQFYKDDLLDFVDGRPLGRLLSYNPKTRAIRTVLDSLYYANGVAIGSDESYVLVSEFWAYRITRYWLAGPRRGQTDFFIVNLPGMPDNISFNGKDTFWLALYTPRDPTTEILQANPFLKKVLLRIPRFLIDGAVSTQAPAFVLGLDMDGNVVHNLQDPSGAQASYTTCTYEYDGMLYFGNTGDNAIKRLPVP